MDWASGLAATRERWTLRVKSQERVRGVAHFALLPFSLETSGKEPTWNFWKYLVAPDGKVVGAWDPTVSVEEVRPQITALVRKLILLKREDL